MQLEVVIKNHLINCSNLLFGANLNKDIFQFTPTRKDVKGDITIVLFSLAKSLKKSPQECGTVIGENLVETFQEIDSFEIVGGFLNLNFSDFYFIHVFSEIKKNKNFGIQSLKNKGLLMIEFSSPNTNKPLHLGHLRNIFLGDSVSSLLDAAGYNVIRTQIINDRGIHICKSMLAWQLFAPLIDGGEKETPQNSGIKGDKFVGKYYVEFDKRLLKEAYEIVGKWNDHSFDDFSMEIRREFERLNESKFQKDEKSIQSIDSKILELAKQHSKLMQKAKDMLVLWEARDPETYLLWTTMNGWVYEGFEKTYHRMNVSFDHLYYESDTYLTGKELVMQGLQKGLFYRKEDGSIWVDLTDEGLDEKLLLRADGTAVYMTQDLGTAMERFNHYNDLSGMVYTVGNEQDYHFKVLFLILQKLGYQWAKNCKHLSYGMVDLPSGKMKSREGTVVDADDLMEEVVKQSEEMTKERGQIAGLSDKEKIELFENIGLAGLKYYLLKVDPKKRMLFDPQESIDLTGNTGPFLQYAHARICSLLSKSKEVELSHGNLGMEILNKEERQLIKSLIQFPLIIEESAENLSPAVLANYLYELVKQYNHFYQNVKILSDSDIECRTFRLELSEVVKDILSSGLRLLGINAPVKM